jgi:hypothetical protein
MLQGDVPLCVTFNDIQGQLPYTCYQNLYHVKHNGQVKLFLTEVEYLTKYIDKSTKHNIVIYAGSAPSNKLPLLMDMFPNVTFILVDPNEHYLLFSSGSQYEDLNIEKILYFKYTNRRGLSFRDFDKEHNINLHKYGIIHRGNFDYEKQSIDLADVKKTIEQYQYRVYIIEDLYTSDMSKTFSTIDCDNIFFISDIRTGVAGDDNPGSIDILWNSAQMFNWIKYLKPKSYMIKFRCPFDFNIEYDKIPNFILDEFRECSEIDFLTNARKGIYEYFDAEVMLQAFAPCDSAETRLVGTTLNVRKYDIIDYEQHMFYYNTVYRFYSWHDLPDTYLDKHIGLDHCADCALMYNILSNYQKKYKLFESEKVIVEHLLNSIRRDITSKSYHGTYYWKLKRDSLIDYFMNIAIVKLILTKRDVMLGQSQIDRRLRPFLNNSSLSSNMDFFIDPPQLLESDLRDKQREPLEPYLYLYLLLNT